MSLIKLLTESGKVKLHPQGQLSVQRYDELKGARKMIKNYLRNSSLRVDIYDAQSVPKDKFVYTKQKDSVFIEITDLLNNKTQTKEFFDQKGEEPLLRQIFKFVEKTESPYAESSWEKMINKTLRKYNVLIKNDRSNIVNKLNDVMCFN